MWKTAGLQLGPSDTADELKLKLWRDPELFFMEKWLFNVVQ
jgi:hypothetical protein